MNGWTRGRPLVRIRWPVALAGLFVALLGWYLFYTQQIVEALQENSQTLAEVYAEVQRGLNTTDEQVVDAAFFELQSRVIGTGVPLVLTAPRAGQRGDTVLSVRNLPFEVDPETLEGQRRILAYVERLDLRHDPVGDPEGQHIHYGDPVEVRWLRWIPWFQVAGLCLVAGVGFTVIRAERRAENERAWTAMARELAHQLGTPISSLQGWLEMLRIDPAERPGDLAEGEVASAIEEDLVRLSRISRRFELIGREPELAEVDLHDVVGELERYLRMRLPRLGPGVELDVDIPRDLPRVRAHEVLLTWALENLVKNALDALAGRGGMIGLRARWEGRWIALTIRDTGPGVDPELGNRIFQPGISTKSGGWGVGLALARRILEGVHGGHIELLDGRERGATFRVRLPVA